MPQAVRLVLCVCVFAAACHRQARNQAESEQPIPVAAEAVQRGDIRGVVSTTGIAVTLPGADFLATVPEPAHLLDISKKAGDRVKSGEVIVRFESPSWRAETAARAAAVKSADMRLQRGKITQSHVHGLIERGAASQKEADDADREVNEAEEEATAARAGQAATEAAGQRTFIRAPFDGVVAERLHNPGDSVGNTANDPILRLIDPHQVEVNAVVPVTDVTRFAVGATARVMAEGRNTPDLMRVLSRPDPETGATTVTIRLAFEQPTDLAPGTQVAVEIDAEQHVGVALLPAIAILKDATGAASVFVASGNRAIKRAVVLGLMDAEHVEIRSGLKVGEMVVTQGQSSLRDGASISVSASDATAPPGK